MICTAKKILKIAWLALIISCAGKENNGNIEKSTALNGADSNIINTIIEDENSFFHIDFSNYPTDRKQLPIGVFDSGTGGLTVLKAIVNFDQYNNKSLEVGADSILDFAKESFIYLGDQANMPYGNYSKENKVDLLKEHIIKDAQFLLSDKYYSSRTDKSYHQDKRPVKAIVVACNTATAYGKSYIEEFLEKAQSEIKVIGVIDAGVKGALQEIDKNENAIIGVLATAGTVASKGYKNTIMAFKDRMGYTGNIEVFSQGGVGIAEAVDEDADYFVKGLGKPRDDYKGPSLEGDLKIDKTLLKVYNFDYDHGKMLCDNNNPDDCTVMQINDAENYVRYHLVTLMENIRKSATSNQLKSIILGCTHYPYLVEEIEKVLSELYHYKSSDGSHVYQELMAEQIQLIDPAVNTAQELHDHLRLTNTMNPTGDIHKSEFYISVANTDNPNNQINEAGNFPYDYKYGRNAGEIQEYVKVVPFSKKNISKDTRQRFEKQIPYVYQMIRDFNTHSPKMKNVKPEDKIL